MSSDLNSLERKRLRWIEDLKWDISEIFTNKWNEILEGKREKEKWFLASVIARSRPVLRRSFASEGGSNPVTIRNSFLLSWIASFFAMTEPINLYKCIWIKVIRMRVRYVDRIYSLDCTRIEVYLHSTLHEISYGKVRKPRIDEDTYILIFRIFDIDEEFGMSERSDDHRK